MLKVRFHAKTRYIATISGWYALTFIVLLFAFKPNISFLNKSSVHLVAVSRVAKFNDRPDQTITSGRPIRLVIPASSIDIPIHEGYYSESTNSWTLSGYYAQFDMDSALANNAAGQTFIYGHNNDFVLGALRHQTPSNDAIAYVYTSSGYIFEYAFQSVVSLSPTDTSILSYSGSPQLLVQTCTGSLDEWRTEYSFRFLKVITI